MCLRKSSGISLRGTFDLPIADYLHRLTPSLTVGTSSPSRRIGQDFVDGPATLPRSMPCLMLDAMSCS
ncbi:hypothetical protein SAMN05444172_8822 [Burkholderia sp. GAS332]|nr:hypothetical protein SAMN05444172_8822 [Burkholderia sp. GAS332]